MSFVTSAIGWRGRRRRGLAKSHGSEQLPNNVFRYVFTVSWVHQIPLVSLTVVTFLIEVVPLEIQRRVVNDLVKHRHFQLVVTLCAAYAGAVLAQGAAKLGLNVYRSWGSKDLAFLPCTATRCRNYSAVPLVLQPPSAARGSVQPAARYTIGAAIAKPETPTVRVDELGWAFLDVRRAFPMDESRASISRSVSATSEHRRCLLTLSARFKIGRGDRISHRTSGK